MKTQTRGRSKATIAAETQQVNVRFSKQEGSLGLLGVSPRIALLPLCLLAACGGNGPASPLPSPTPTPTPSPTPSPSDKPDLAGPFFAPDHLVEVAIELSPSDWDALRAQTRSVDALIGADCLAQPFDDPFTWFSANVVIDGQRYGPVGLRKKGFLGSLSESKPSLKVKLSEFDPLLEHVGLETFTLNNSVQDPSFARTCLAYRVHTLAGVAAPRCNFADVTVNGQHLGVYVNVETVKKPFLRRNFSRADGTLWEGTVSDFRPAWMETFELKTSQPEGGARARLDQLTQALEAPDATALDEMGKVVDLEEFMSFWAVESVIGHWDGYPGNANNFFVYDDPSVGRLKFLPWGPDAAFTSTAAGERPNASVLTVSALPHRLYQLSASRARYLEIVRRVLAVAFNEADLLAELTRIEAQIASRLEDSARAGWAQGLANVRAFIQFRRRGVERELSLGGPGINPTLRDSICIVPVGELDASFSTTFGTHPTPNAFTTGTSTIGGTLDSRPIPRGPGGAAAGFGQSTDDAGQVVILTVSVLAPNDFALVYLVLPPMSFGPGSYPIDGTIVRGGLLRAAPGAAELQLLGYFWGGAVELSAGSTTLGDPIVGRVRTPMIRF